MDNFLDSLCFSLVTVLTLSTIVAIVLILQLEAYPYSLVGLALVQFFLYPWLSFSFFFFFIDKIILSSVSTYSKFYLNIIMELQVALCTSKIGVTSLHFAFLYEKFDC